MSQLFKALSVRGLQGLAHTLRQALIARRIARVRHHMERERALHLEQMAQLRVELDALQLRQINTTARAARFWKAQP